MKILQVGCGGVGSNLVEHVNRAYLEGQVGAEIEYDLADFDSVEPKNIKSGQNFGPKDIGKNKATALKKRYDCVNKAFPVKVIGKTCEPYDLVILAVDNVQTRKEIFEACAKIGDFTTPDYIDLRAEGRTAFCMPKMPLEAALRTLDLGDLKPGGCQLEADTKKGRLQYGSRVAAAMGIQALVNYLRGDENKMTVVKI